jgi:molybdopterin-biosynthesis enzyme MoeA-like protein
VSTFDQLSALAATYYFRQPTSLGQSWRKSMEKFAKLMQRLLEIHSGERRSAKLIAEDERLMRSLQKKSLAGKATQRLELSEE